MNIRKAEISDRMELIRLRKQLWPECSSDLHSLEVDIILSSPGIVVIAELSKSVLVGFAEISIRNDYVEGTKSSPIPYLEGWYVEPGNRKKGIGKSLIKAAEEYAVLNGFSELASDSEIENQSNIEIHKSIGFKEVGRSVHFIKPLQS